jgi:hypothetical protein
MMLREKKNQITGGYETTTRCSIINSMTIIAGSLPSGSEIDKAAAEQ